MSTTPEELTQAPSTNIPQVSPAQANSAPLPTEEKPENKEPETKKSKLKLFTLNDVRRTVPVDVIWPSVYPGYEPWGFIFKLALSKDLEKKRQEWLAMPEAEANDPELSRSNILDQVCDLLVATPTGFGDLTANIDPGSALKAYVSNITDPDQKETAYRIITAAYNGYWGKAYPRPSQNGTGL